VIDSARQLFAEDASLPLDVRVLGSERRDGVVVHDVRFAGARGGDVAAYIVEREDAPAGVPGVVYAHGGRRPKRDRLLPQAVELARAGMHVLLPETSLALDGDADRDVRRLADAVLVQRRALGVLAERGTSRLGYFGHSNGGWQGAILSAVDARLDAIVIAGEGAGLAESLRAKGVADEEYLRRLDALDPAHYVSAPARRRLLVQHGRADAVMPIDAARALFEVAAEPKEWAEYDCDHGIDAHPPALADRIRFLQEALT
jgi:dipeptidyl aminopeptidase/acylaminoacyl peptidase